MGTSRPYVKVCFDFVTVPEIRGGFKFNPAFLWNEFSMCVSTNLAKHMMTRKSSPSVA